MRKFLVLALALAISLIPILPAQAATGSTYYVATTGNDANPGTQAQPWKTVQNAAKSVAAGDTVIIASGAYKENVTISTSGTTSAPITFQGQNTPTVVQSTPTTTACLGSGNSCILGTVMIVASQVSFKNMEVGGSPVKPGIVAGITVKGSNNEVSSNFIHNSWKEGISVNAGTSSNRILNNKIMYAVVSGIYFDGQNHLIQGNTITHSVTRPADRVALPGSTDPDGIRFFGSGSIVRGNVIKDIYLDESPEADAPHQDCFQTWGSANDITFDRNYCELENPTSYSSPMEKFFMVERGSSSTSTVSGLKIVNNIFVSKATTLLWTPIQLGNEACSTSYPLQSITIENNTFVHPGDVAADFGILLRCTNSATIRNNVFYNFGNDSYSYIYQDRGNNSIAISNNSVYNSKGTPPKGGAYPGDTALWMKNPQFNSGSDFHLQNISPLIDTGYADGISVDFDGNPRPQGNGIDVGSFEFAGSAQTVATGTPIAISSPTPIQTSTATPVQTYTSTPIQTGTPMPIQTGTSTPVPSSTTPSTSNVLSVCKSGCAYSTIQSAVNAVKPGQIIEVQDGTYSESVSLTTNGTSSNWITLRAKVGSTVWIDGSNLGNVSNINIGNHSYWKISSLKMRLAAQGSALNADGASDGITAGVGANNIVLEGLTIEAPNGDGIDLRGANYGIQILNNEIYDMRKANPSYTGDGHGIHVLQQANVAATHDILVKGNFVHDSHGKACLATSDYTALNAVAPSNIVFENNKAQDCTNGIKINTDGIYRYNLIVDTGKYTSGVEKPDNCFQAFTHDAENNVRKAQVYSNTTVGCNNAYNFDMTYNQSTPTQTITVFRNNIAYNPRNYFVRVSNTVLQSDGNNLFFKSGGGGSYIGYTPGNGSIVNTDPQFNNDYTLKDTSPAIDMGTVVDSSLAYLGDSPDIGAFESAASGSVVSPTSLPTITTATPTLTPSLTPTLTLLPPTFTPTPPPTQTPKPTKECRNGGRWCR